PLRDRQVLGERHQAVQALIDGHHEEVLRESFRALGDVERILARVALRTARPRDLSTLRDALAALPAIREALARIDAPRLAALAAELGRHDEDTELLGCAIAPQPPARLRDGGVIAE